MRAFRRFTTTLMLQLHVLITCSALLAGVAPRLWAQQGGDTNAQAVERLFPGAANLQADAEQDRLLVRAREAAAEGKIDLAVAMWQKLLNDEGRNLIADEVLQPVGPTSGPLMIYRSVRERAEAEIVRSAAGLAAYQAAVGADASALLATAVMGKEEATWAEVARRYFLSDVGDDATYKIACLALDRHDFAAAERMLTRLTLHPRLSVAKGEIAARLAVAAAHLGDEVAAQEAMRLLKADRSVEKERVALIEQEVFRAAAVGAAGKEQADGWPMPFGVPSRTANMKRVPAAELQGPLCEMWVRDLPLPRMETSQSSATPALAREEMVRRWRGGGWRPTGGLLFEADRVYLKSAVGLECFSASANSEQPIWRSAWENQYELDGMSRQMLMTTSAVPALASSVSQPNSLAEIWMFGDRVHASMAIDGGMVYSIEGERMGANVPLQADRRLPWGATPRRSRRNWLAAYQAKGGKAIWTRSAAEGNKAGGAEIGYLAAPTPCGELLLAPVTDGGTIWLQGLERATGKMVWTTFLCDEPRGGASPWAEVVLAAEGGEAYLSCGCGVAFAIDTRSGEVRWAARYSRGDENTRMQARGRDSELPRVQVPSGWDDDVTIVAGRLVVVMASDGEQVLALDRRTGRRVWESPRTLQGSAANYCLGVRGGGLFVAGKNVVRKYELASGRLVAQRDLADSLGRGCVTKDEVLLPVQDGIVRLDLNLQEERQTEVVLSRKEPVGNLFSDGQRLWMVSGGRVAALTPVEERLKQLAQQIARGDGNAQLNRMRLYLHLNRGEVALEDARGARQLLAAETTPKEATAKVLEAIWEERLAVEQPVATLKLLTELHDAASDPSVAGADAVERVRDLVASAVSSIRQRRPADAIGGVLAAGNIIDEHHLTTAAGMAIDAVAASGDGPALVAAVESGSAAARLMSMRTAARLAPSAVKMGLKNCLQHRDERVQAAAARTLVRLNEQRNVLETLVALLESPELELRSHTHQTLQALTGQTISFNAEGTVGERGIGIRAWRQWVETQGTTATLAVAMQEQAKPLGRILVAMPNLLIELDFNRQERAKIPLPGGSWGCQGLPNGHRLVAIHAHSMVIEFDDAGREVWRKDRLPGPPTSVERLDNGSTLVACGSANQVVEIAPDGSMTTIEVLGQPICAQRLENGNTLVTLSEAKRVVEVNSRGKVLAEIRLSSSPTHAVRLDSGNTLITLTQARKVVEYDATGKSIVWMTALPLVNAQAAARLPNGNTLVADHSGVQEFDAAGKQIVWRLRQMQAVGLSSF
jgi:hypothetical protein